MPWQSIEEPEDALYPFESFNPRFSQSTRWALGEQRAPRVLCIFGRHDPLYLVALPEHWGNQGPLGFYPLKVEHLFPQLPVRALGGQTAPWPLSCWQLTSDQLVLA